MIVGFDGVLRGLEGESAIAVECHGVHYAVTVSTRDKKILWPAQSGKVVGLYVRHVFRETEQALFGFILRSDRDVFDCIVEVEGFGPRTAMRVLDVMDVAEFRRTLAGKEVATFAEVKGVGPKLAVRLVEKCRKP